jgi:hypothetical protein
MRSAEGSRWASATMETSALISAILLVCHPDLYHAGLQCLEQLPKEKLIMSALEVWSSVFNGISVISNRETPFHRDTQTRAEWYDILCTLGGDDDTVLELCELGIRLLYRSGTVTALSGQLLEHGVSATVAERLCYAYWMRDFVHEAMNVQSPGWMVRQTYVA